MRLAEIPAAAHCRVRHRCGHELHTVDVWRYAGPPGPRGNDPEGWVEFWPDEHFGDPDDGPLTRCPGCGDDLELADVEKVA